MTPLSNHLLVELRPPADKSSGGIFLPDNWRENWTDGIVLDRGPGYAVPGDDPFRTPFWMDPGDVVLFPKHAWRHWEGRRGIVADHDLVAVNFKGNSAVEPLNDWVLVQQDADIPSSGTIALPEAYHPKPMSGVIVDWGEGARRRDGALAGTRKDVWQIMGLPKDECLKDRRVYWDSEVEVLACGRERLEFLLVRAGDLYAIEVN